MDEDQEEKVVSNGPKEEEVNEEKKVKEEEPDGEKANGTPTPNKEEVDEIVEVPSEKGDTKALTNGKSKLTDEDYFRLSSAEIMTHYPPISTEMSAKYTYKCIKENCVPKLEDVAKSKDPVIKEIFSKAEVWRPKPPVVIKDFKPRKPRAPRGKSKKAPKPLDLSDPNQYYQNLMQPPPTEELVQMKSSEVLRINQVIYFIPPTMHSGQICLDPHYIIINHF